MRSRGAETRRLSRENQPQGAGAARLGFGEW